MQASVINATCLKYFCVTHHKLLSQMDRTVHQLSPVKQQGVIRLTTSRAAVTVSSNHAKARRTPNHFLLADFSFVTNLLGFWVHADENRTYICHHLLCQQYTSSKQGLQIAPRHSKQQTIISKSSPRKPNPMPIKVVADFSVQHMRLTTNKFFTGYETVAYLMTFFKVEINYCAKTYLKKLHIKFLKVTSLAHAPTGIDFFIDSYRQNHSKLSNKFSANIQFTSAYNNIIKITNCQSLRKSVTIWI